MVPMFILYARLAKRYLPATRDLRRLDAAARSPIFSHFSESMAGVSTIRAMQSQEQAIRTNMSRLETQMEAYYLSNTAVPWPIKKRRLEDLRPAGSAYGCSSMAPSWWARCASWASTSPPPRRTQHKHR